MYVALRAFKVAILDEKGVQTGVRTTQVGEALPEAEQWTYPVIISLLNLDHIKWKGEGVPTHNLHKGSVVDMAKYRQGTRLAGKPLESAAVIEDLKPSQPKLDPLQCGACLKRFKNSGGLKSHFRTKHPEASAGQAG